MDWSNRSALRRRVESLVGRLDELTSAGVCARSEATLLASCLRETCGASRTSSWSAASGASVSSFARPISTASLSSACLMDGQRSIFNQREIVDGAYPVRRLSSRTPNRLAARPSISRTRSAPETRRRGPDSARAWSAVEGGTARSEERPRLAGRVVRLASVAPHGRSRHSSRCRPQSGHAAASSSIVSSSSSRSAQPLHTSCAPYPPGLVRLRAAPHNKQCGCGVRWPRMAGLLRRVCTGAYTTTGSLVSTRPSMRAEG